MELDHESAWRRLAGAWTRASAAEESREDPVLADLVSLKRTIGLRYVALTQTLAKTCEPRFDALSLEGALPE